LSEEVLVVSEIVALDWVMSAKYYDDVSRDVAIGNARFEEEYKWNGVGGVEIYCEVEGENTGGGGGSGDHSLYGLEGWKKYIGVSKDKPERGTYQLDQRSGRNQ